MTVAGALDLMLDRAATVDWHHLDEATRDAALRAVTDALGVAAAGDAAPGVRASLRAYARAAGSGGVTVPWWGVSLPPADAAMALSLLVHAWDFDDTHDAAVVHTCAVALPASLAVAQARGAGGADMLAGFVAGVEVLARLSLAIGVRPGVIRSAGLGSLGAAAAAARTLGLGPAGMRRTLSLAASTAMSPTTRQAVTDGAISKRHQPGFAVRHGVTAAYLAAEEVAGPQGWFTGTHGLGRLVPDEGSATASLIAPGWEVTRLSLKPFPACRYTHTAIDAVIGLIGGVPAPDVARVTVHLPSGSTHALVARPWARRGQPVVDAQFSVPWLVAAALEFGSIDLGTVTGEAVLNPEVEARARTVEVLLDQPASRSVMTPVRIEVVDSAGHERVVEIDRAPGSPDRPLSWDAILDKAAGCLLVAGRDPGHASVLRRVVDNLAGADVEQAVHALGTAKQQEAPTPRAVPATTSKQSS